MPASEEDMVAQLTRLGYHVTAPARKYPPRSCYVCGALEEEVQYRPEAFDMAGIDLDDADTLVAQWLTTFVVQTNPGEEGHDKVVIHACEYHDSEMIDKLGDIGIMSHHHGGTALLVNRACPGDRSPDLCPHGRHSPYDLSDDGMYI